MSTIDDRGWCGPPVRRSQRRGEEEEPLSVIVLVISSSMSSPTLMGKIRELSSQRRDLEALPWKIHSCVLEPPPSPVPSCWRTEATQRPPMMFPPLEPYFCGLSRNTCSSPTGRWVEEVVVLVIREEVVVLALKKKSSSSLSKKKLIYVVLTLVRLGKGQWW